MSASDFSLLQDEEGFSYEETPSLPPQTPWLPVQWGTLRNMASLSSVSSALIQGHSVSSSSRGQNGVGEEVLRGWE